MSILDRTTVGKEPHPRRICVYGAHGTGKSTWAAKFKNPIVIATEDGTKDIDVARVRVVTAMEALLAANECIESDYETIVIDSADWFEKMIEEALHAENFKSDYGKGAVETARRFDKLLEQLDKCVESGKTVILIAHEEVRKVEDVSGASWDRLQPKLGKKACGRLLEWCDEVFHASLETFVTKQDEEFGRTRGVARTSDRRILNTNPHPSYIAKRRIELPDVLDMSDPILTSLQS